MSLRSRNYWIEQAKERVLSNERRADKYATELMELYDHAANRIENDTVAMIAKFTKDNNLTQAEATKLLAGKEYSVWRKSIERYLADAGGAAKGSKAYLELNTLAMKGRLSRQEHLLANVYQNMIGLAGDTTTRLEDLLGDMLKINYYEGCWRLQRGLGMGFNIAKINESLIQQVLSYPWSERHFSEAVWGQCDHLAMLTKREISLGFIQGSSVQEMAASINRATGAGRYAAERLVRTECSHFATEGDMMAYKECGATRYRFLGGGEGWKCECDALNGEEFDIDAAEGGINLPPIHPNCKCTTVPVYTEIPMFGKRDVTPLNENIKFQEWLEKHGN